MSALRPDGMPWGTPLPAGSEAARLWECCQHPSAHLALALLDGLWRSHPPESPVGSQYREAAICVRALLAHAQRGAIVAPSTRWRAPWGVVDALLWRPS